MNTLAAFGGEARSGGAFRSPSLDASLTRSLDIVVAVILLIAFFPLLVLIAMSIALTSPGPILFRQSRIGYGGAKFKCLKFRTMAIDAEERLLSLLETDAVARAEWDRDQKLRNDPRIVGIGNFLRRSSLDELPQLFNVPMGEMSLVGPRPIVEAERRRYGRYFDHYCAVRPGITGLWQISGRNDVSYRRRVAFDVLYARSRSAAGDLTILVKTVPCVLLARGSY